MRVSVVIPTLNEEKNILNCLRSIEKQSVKPYEIIVSDGSSEDRTLELVKKFSKSCKIPIRIVVSKRRSPSIQRQKGAEVARGDIVAFIDADSIANEHWIKKIVEEFKDKRVVGVYGEVIVPRPYRTLSMIFNIYMKISSHISPSPSGMNIAVRNEILKRENFDESLITCEEIDLFHRLKKYGKIKFIESKVQTSSRRIKKWGILRFFIFHLLNVLRYNIAKSPSRSY